MMSCFRKKRFFVVVTFCSFLYLLLMVYGHLGSRSIKIATMTRLPIYELPMNHASHDPILSPMLGSLELIQSPPANTDKIIAIGCAVSTKGILGITEKTVTNVLPIFTQLLPSFCNTASDGYEYIFYITYDYNDPFFVNASNVVLFESEFHSMNKEICNQKVVPQLKMLKLDYFGKPACAQNDAMIAAYLDGVQYYYRVNDDTNLKTPKWTERFIEILSEQSNLGVVGPTHSGGNTRILTYDFVHRTHILIHGLYYPKQLYSLYADYWITNIYRPEQCHQPPDVQVNHTMVTGTRYNLDRITAVHPLIAPAMLKGKSMIGMWASLVHHLSPNGSHQAYTPGNCVIIPVSDTVIADLKTRVFWSVEYVKHFIPEYKPVILLGYPSNSISQEILKGSSDIADIYMYPLDILRFCPQFPDCMLTYINKSCSGSMLYWDITVPLTSKIVSTLKLWLAGQWSPHFCAKHKLTDKNAGSLIAIFGHRSSKVTALSDRYKEATRSCYTNLYSIMATAESKQLQKLPTRGLVQTIMSQDADAFFCVFGKDNCIYYTGKGKPVLVFVRIDDATVCKNMEEWKKNIKALLTPKVQFIVLTEVDRLKLLYIVENPDIVHTLPKVHIPITAYRPPQFSIVTLNKYAHAKFQKRLQQRLKDVLIVVHAKQRGDVSVCREGHLRCFLSTSGIIIGSQKVMPQKIASLPCSTKPIFVSVPLFVKNQDIIQKSPHLYIKYDSEDDLETKLRAFKTVFTFNPNTWFRIYSDIDIEVYIFHFWQSLLQKAYL